MRRLALGGEHLETCWIVADTIEDALGACKGAEEVRLVREVEVGGGGAS